MRYINVLNSIFVKLFKLFYKKSFKSFGTRSAVVFPLQVNGIENITIGNNVTVNYRTWLAAVPLTGAANCDLIIGNGTTIGNFNHIYATQRIVIGENVLTADKVYISDNLHSYENIEMPIVKQAIKQIKEVNIGDGSWLGENVCIIGASIGKNCVIGANAVVTKDIPSYSVAVGAPAKVIKQYSFEKKEWIKTV